MDNLIEGEAGKSTSCSAQHKGMVLVVEGGLMDMHALKAILAQQELVVIDQMNELDVVMLRNGIADGVLDDGFFEIKTRQHIEDCFLTAPMIEPNNRPYWRQFSGRHKKAARW